jgi:biofilm PGA synthesis N-glycosyltransferase PgaC
MTVTVIIPAYNEFTELPRAVAGLRSQTTPPDRVVVALNNATDGLYEVAVATGADVLNLGACPGLKAEALNKAISLLTFGPHDRIVVCDADSILSPTWLETATSFVSDTTVVGGIFLGEPGGGWLGMAQRNEYQSYAREVYAHNDKAWVLTGTGTMFTGTHAAAAIAARGHLYDETVATEDFELTVMFRTLGYRTVSPRGCEVTTEVMSTTRALRDQRIRWYRGAIETLRLHGVSRVTAPYLLQQSKIALGLFLSWSAISLMVAFGFLGYLTINAWWLLALIPATARIVSGQHRWFSATVLPEMFYDLLLQKALVIGWWQAFTNKPRVWNAAEGV